MKEIRLTTDKGADDNYFAMSKAEAPNPAFVVMFEEMIRILKKEGWSQRRLCAKLGYGESWLSKIKHSGRGMDLTVLLRICEATGIPPEKLLSGYPCPKKAESEVEKIAKLLAEIPPDEVRRLLLSVLEGRPKS